MARRRKIKIVYKKLGREKLWGQAHVDEWTIEVDERLRGKKKIEILIHEAQHILFPEKDEDYIAWALAVITRMLWSQNIREIDNCNDTPLQDGRK